MIRYQGKNRRTVNYLKVMQFDTPEWVPCAVHFLPAAWIRHREALEAVVLRHPRLFPGYRQGQTDFDFTSGTYSPLYEEGRHTDCWGTVWDNIQRGMDSQPVVHPLADWEAFPAWKMRLPDPETTDIFGPRPPWGEIRDGFRQAKARGDLATGGGLPHGHFFMRLVYLRGFENLMLDIATADPRLDELCAILTDYNVRVVQRYLEQAPEMMSFGEDLGMQTALPISPAAWRRYIKPSYEATFGLCRDRGIPVYLHSDGHILEIIPDLIETGVRILNPQIRANGLAGLQQFARGKVAINQDLDRQLFPFATPDEIHAHIRDVFHGLYLKEGGLMLAAEVDQGVPLENVEAICQALEELCHLPEPDVV